MGSVEDIIGFFVDLITDNEPMPIGIMPVLPGNR
jgi:hypothetical protein